MTQLALFEPAAAAECVACVICAAQLFTLADLRCACSGGGHHEVGRADYFRLYRLGGGV
jgi:hypothetical protein